VNVQPQVKDQVMLFSMNQFHPQMFDEVSDRENEIIIDTNTNGYSPNAMIGILMSTLKAMAAVQFIVQGQGNDVLASLKFNAKTSITSKREFDLGFMSEDGEDHPLNLTIGENRPTKVSRRSSLDMDVGYRGGDDPEEMVDAPTNIKHSEKAPLDIELRAETNISRKEKAPHTETNEAPHEYNFQDKATVDANFLAAVVFKFGPKATFLIQSDTDVDIDSKKPVGINAGLRKTVLGPYWKAETSANETLSQAVQQAIPQMAILDAISGGVGFFAALAPAIMAFNKAMVAADNAADKAAAPCVK